MEDWDGSTCLREQSLLVSGGMEWRHMFEGAIPPGPWRGGMTAHVRVSNPSWSMEGWDGVTCLREQSFLVHGGVEWRIMFEGAILAGQWRDGMAAHV